MFAMYGDLCHLCGHHGARQADHLTPVSVDPDQPIDPRLMRPAHGGGSVERGLDNPCPTCGRRCNQERGNGHTTGRSTAQQLNTSEAW